MRQPLSAFALALTLAVSPAFAGIADSPLPDLLAGETTYHLYTVPSVLNIAGLATFFGCTSLEATETIQVGVEVFGSFGGLPANDAAATSLSVAPGATRIFGTNTAFGIPISSNLASGPASGSSARILATSKKLACTAFVADTGNAPPTSSWQLTIIAKLKQKACN